jgi:hypothetical protein
LCYLLHSQEEGEFDPIGTNTRMSVGVSLGEIGDLLAVDDRAYAMAVRIGVGIDPFPNKDDPILGW